MGKVRPFRKIQAEKLPVPANAAGKPLRALVVEDSEEDTVLLIEELKQGGYEPCFERVDTPEEMTAALESREWDIVLADYVMPRFSGLAALLLLKEKGVDIPLIMVSGKIGEDALLEAMKAGAYDFVVKDNLSKVGPAIEKGLEDSAARRKKKDADQRLAVSNKLYSVLSGIKKMIIRTQDKQRIFQETCRILVESGQFRLAWIGLADHESSLVRPAAFWGFDEGYIAGIRVSTADEPEGRGPAGTAIRKGGHFVCRDIGSDPRMLPWRSQALERGFRSCAAFPIRSGLQTVGAVSVYSDKTDYFGNDEIALLDELAEDVSYGVQAIEIEEQRQRTEGALRNETAVSEALLRVTEVTTASLNWESIAESVLALLPRIASCESAAIIMLDEDGNLLPHKTVGASDSLQSFFFTSSAKLIEIGALEHVAETKRPLVVKKEELSFMMPAIYSKNLELRNLIIAPIIARDNVSGFLGANFDRLPTDPRVTAIIQGMAGQLGAAYESACLYEETQRKSLDLAKKMEALKVLHEIDRMILSTLDRDEMLSRVVLQIKRLLPADTGYVAVLDPEKGAFTYRCGWGMEPKKGEALPARGYPGYDTVKSGKALLRANISEEGSQSAPDRAFRDMGIRSDMFVPIFSKGTGIGIIRLGSSRVAGFSLDDVGTAEKLAYQIGIAWENSRLIADLEDMLLNTVKAMSSAIDAKSPWTKGHSERVTSYAVRIAQKLGLSETELEKIRLAGLLHDVGKIGTYDTILDKPGRLSDEEFELVKKHPDRGCEILAPIKQFKDLLPAIRCHHERWDGTGYPAGLKGEEVPLLARILCVADSFDSMTADRPYRPAPGREYAISEFKRCSGTQFDPKVIEALLKVLDE